MNAADGATLNSNTAAVCQALLLQKSEEEMLRFELLVTGGLCQLLGSDDGGPGFLSELFRRGLHLDVESKSSNRMGASSDSWSANRKRWLGLHGQGRLTGSAF